MLPIQAHGAVARPDGREIATPTSFAAAFRVTDTIDEVARVSHTRHASDSSLATIERSLVVGDVLFTVSPVGVMATDLGSFDELGWAGF